MIDTRKHFSVQLKRNITSKRHLKTPWKKKNTYWTMTKTVFGLNWTKNLIDSHTKETFWRNKNKKKITRLWLSLKIWTFQRKTLKKMLSQHINIRMLKTWKILRSLRHCRIWIFISFFIFSQLTFKWWKNKV